ncbi:tyrosine-type recombinase/integrase [Euzebya rosea]|uniref:tyrosine-type recombinase/integrase n=1 Tax=Euzebya rosea TaxID=2052804 RepID=UPI000D3EC949|nr:tyrosine-type recombinase/integrase [Euzebya rosea]
MTARRPRGSGSVFFDASRGVWKGQAPAPAGPGGKRRRFRVQADSEAAAWALLEEARNRGPRRGGKPRETLGEYLVWFCDTHLQRQVDRGAMDPGTWRSYRQNLVGHVSAGIGHVKLSQLTAEDIEDLLVWLGRHDRRGRGPQGRRGVDAGKGLAGSTQRTVLVQLRAALKVAVRYKRIGDNPAQLVDLPPGPVEDQRWLELEEAEQLLAAVPTSDPFRAFYVVGLPLGLRVGEAVALQWSDVDLDGDEPSMTLRNQLVRARDPRTGEMSWAMKPRLKRRRAGESRRIVLPQFVVGELRAVRRAQLERRLALDGVWDGRWDLVLSGRDGGPVWTDQVRRHLTATCERAGIPRATPHALRRSAASFLLAKGVPLPQVMQILGWRSAKVALEVYARATKASQAEAAQAMDELFGQR